MSLLIVMDSYADLHVWDEPTYAEMLSEQYPDEYQIIGSVDGSSTIGALIEEHGYIRAKQIANLYLFGE